MKQKRYRKGFVGICLSLLLLSGIAAPQILAAEQDDPYAYVPINQTPTEDTMIGTVDELTGTGEQEDTAPVVSEYNLASENWEELLAEPYGTTSEVVYTTVSEEAESSEAGGWFFGGNEESDGGLSKIFIIAIIAFAVGAIGISFFIYSQFIYKAKLRRKAAEANGGEEDDWYDEEPEQEEPEPEHKPNLFGEQVIRPQEPTRAEPEQPATPAEPKQAQDSVLSKEDEEKLKEVDWDKFFSDGF